MIYCSATFLIVLLVAGLLALGWRAYQNHLEIARLRRSGFRRLAFRRYHRGGADPELLRCLAELTLLVLLLVALLGWLAAEAPRW